VNGEVENVECANRSLHVAFACQSIRHDATAAGEQASNRSDFASGSDDIRIGDPEQARASQGGGPLQSEQHRRARGVADVKTFPEILTIRRILKDLERHVVQVLVRDDDKALAVNIGEHGLDQKQEQFPRGRFVEFRVAVREALL